MFTPMVKGQRVRVSGVSNSGQHAGKWLGTLLSDRDEGMCDEVRLDGLGRHQFVHAYDDYTIEAVADDATMIMAA